MAPKANKPASKGGKSATRSSGSGPAVSTTFTNVSPSGDSTCSAADEVMLLRLYKRCLEGRPKEKLASLGAADGAIQELQALVKSQPSALGCLLLVSES